METHRISAGGFSAPGSAARFSRLDEYFNNKKFIERPQNRQLRRLSDEGITLET